MRQVLYGLVVAFALFLIVATAVVYRQVSSERGVHAVVLIAVGFAVTVWLTTRATRK